jgi:hypothetical protein
MRKNIAEYLINLTDKFKQTSLEAENAPPGSRSLRKNVMPVESNVKTSPTDNFL